jgi:hypothetical protein
MTGYGAATLTLTAANTNYNLLALIRAIAAYAQAKPTCRELIIQSSIANGNAYVWKGADNMTLASHGPELAAGGMIPNRSDKNNIPLNEIWLLTNTGGSTVNIEWMYS